MLTLKRASKHRPGGPWDADDYDMFDGGLDLTRSLWAVLSDMTRYKGRTSQKAIERDFPNIVEIAVPPRGLGAQLDAMHHFHRARGIQACIGLGRRDRGRDYLRWYFTVRQRQMHLQRSSAARK